MNANLTNSQLLSMTAAEYAALSNTESKARLERLLAGSFEPYMLSEDQAYWTRQNVKTGMDLARLLLAETVSDTYKELYGIRPRNLSGKSLEQLREEYDSLCRESQADVEWEDKWEAQDKAEEARRIEAAEDAKEDAMWNIQDALMGL